LRRPGVAVRRVNDNAGMQIAKDTVVTITYRIADALGRLLEGGKEPAAYLHGGYDNTFPKLEAALEGKQPGDQVSLQLEPADAFGERDEALVRTIPKSEFPPGVKVGGQLEGTSDSGQPVLFNVMKIKGDAVHLDGNHPLAGKAVKISVKVVSVRAATQDEIQHRHAHGSGGHHH
jgi:FKBP-type peptidyl-prolyl cis-trans isomerase SlyD